MRCNTRTPQKSRDYVLGCRFPAPCSAPSPQRAVSRSARRNAQRGSLHSGWARLGRGAHRTPCPLQRQARGGGKEGRKEGTKREREERDGQRSRARQAGSSAPDARASLAHRRRAAMLGHSPVAGCQQSAEQEGSCTKKHISLLKAGHLATLMKSALVSGSALSTLFYFCPRARFSYYKQGFQS